MWNYGIQSIMQCLPADLYLQLPSHSNFIGIKYILFHHLNGVLPLSTIKQQIKDNYGICVSVDPNIHLSRQYLMHDFRMHYSIA